MFTWYCLHHVESANSPGGILKKKLPCKVQASLAASIKWKVVHHIYHGHSSVCMCVCVHLCILSVCVSMCVLVPACVSFLHAHVHDCVYVIPVWVYMWLDVQRIEELEATLYSALQQEQPACQAVAESLTDRQREELRLAVDKLRRQILRQSRQYDSQILQERMELLQQAQQVRLKTDPFRLLSLPMLSLTLGNCPKPLDPTKHLVP